MEVRIAIPATTILDIPLRYPVTVAEHDTLMLEQRRPRLSPPGSPRIARTGAARWHALASPISCPGACPCRVLAAVPRAFANPRDSLSGSRVNVSDDPRKSQTAILRAGGGEHCDVGAKPSA